MGPLVHSSHGLFTGAEKSQAKERVMADLRLASSIHRHDHSHHLHHHQEKGSLILVPLEEEHNEWFKTKLEENGK